MRASAGSSRSPTSPASTRRCARRRELPTTSQPSIGDFLAVYEPLARRRPRRRLVHLAGGISGTVEARAPGDAAARPGAAGERVESSIDGERLRRLGLSFALAAAAAGRTAATSRASPRAPATRDEALRIWFAVDTLEYLRRGGRIGAAQAWLGSALRIKPILSLEPEITPVERVRTSRRAFDRIVDYMGARKADGADGWVVQHIQAPERVAERLIERGREIFGCEPPSSPRSGP